MKTSNPRVPKVLQELWDCKEAIYREVAHLPRREALNAILDNAHKTAEQMREKGLLRRSSVPPIAAEAPVSYGTRGQRARRSRGKA